MTSAAAMKRAAGFAGRDIKAIQICLIVATFKAAFPQAISNDEAFAELIGLLTDEEGDDICRLASRGKA